MCILKRKILSALRFHWSRIRKFSYRYQFDNSSRKLQKIYGSRVEITDCVSSKVGADAIWAELAKTLPEKVTLKTIEVDQASEFRHFWDRHQDLYQSIGNGLEKAVEHELTFRLFDFDRIRRYCDVASSQSPIEQVFKRDHPGIEYWKQDLIYSTDLDRRIIGGFAQNMTDVPSGYFDALALHCSFEHFSGTSDQEFLLEVDRVLNPTGACFIVPLYLDLEARIFVDPTRVSIDAIKEFDPEGKLCLARNYLQEHGRYYSPQTFCDRLLSRLPSGLEATLVRFARLPAAEVYLSFGLILHRKQSVFI